MRLNSVIYAIVPAHALVSGYHGWSHFAAMVPTSVAQNIFVAVVVFAAPLLAVVLLLLDKIQFGREVFTLSMLCSFIFGAIFHFGLDTADLCSSVSGTGSHMFFVSAVLLAAVEFIGLIVGCILLTLPSGLSFQRIAPGGR